MSRELIKSIEDMEKISSDLKSKGKKIITTNGSFDVLHLAHVHLLQKAKALGNILIVFLSNDESIRISKGSNRPIIPESERAEMLASLKPVDYVVLFPKGMLLSYLERIKADVHVKGGSGDPEKLKNEKEFVKKWGGSHITFDLEEGYSTTKSIDKILRIN